MKHISNIIDINRIKGDSSDGEPPNIPPYPGDCAHIVNVLFRELKSIFPAFRQAWPGDDEFARAKLNWTKAFADSKIDSIEKLRYGIKKCRKSGGDFAPSVGKFILWCTPSADDLGFPGENDAYQISILMNRQFSTYVHEDERVDTVIRHAISQIDCMLYRNMNAENARKTFNHYYDLSLKQFIEGKLQVIPKALPQRVEDHPSDKPRADSANAKCMDLVKRMATHAKQRTMPTNNI